jgi:hypothetical protein
MKKIAAVLPSWSETRPVLMQQATLALAEVGLVLLLRGRYIVGSLLLVLAHVWAWRQTIWRQQNITRIIRTMREMGKS